MSWAAAADADRYDRLNDFMVPAQQPLLLASWFKVADVVEQRGIVSLSAWTTDARMGDYFGLTVNTTGRVRVKWVGAALNGPVETITADTWHLAGIYLAEGFTGAEQDMTLWLDGNVLDTTATPPLYVDPFVSACCGDGVLTNATGTKGAFAALWASPTAEQVDLVMAALLTTRPVAILPTPVFQAPFETAVATGFTAVGTASLDISDNPALSGTAVVQESSIVIV